MPCSCARPHMMSEATLPPRCVWSSARPSSNIGRVYALLRQFRWPAMPVPLLERGTCREGELELVHVVVASRVVLDPDRRSRPAPLLGAHPKIRLSSFSCGATTHPLTGCATTPT